MTGVPRHARHGPRGHARRRYPTDDAAAQDLHAALARGLQHRIPSCCALSQPARRDMREGDGFRCEIGKVPADEAGFGNEVCARQRGIEGAFGRGHVRARWRVVQPRLAGAVGLGRFRQRQQLRNFGRIGGRKDVAAAVHVDAVARGAREPLDEIDAAVHEGCHGPVGTRPPVAVGFARFVRCERKGIAGLDDHHIVLGHARPRDSTRLRFPRCLRRQTTILCEAAMQHPGDEMKCCRYIMLKSAHVGNFQAHRTGSPRSVDACAPPNAFLDRFDRNNELELFPARMHLVR